MKNKLFLGLIFAGITLFAQETHHFKYRLDYEMEGVEGQDGVYFSGKHFIPEKFSENSKNSLAIFPFLSLSTGSEFTFIDGNKAITIQNKDLDNNFGISSSYYDYNNSVKVMYDKAILKKTDKQLQILDRKCTQYQLFVEVDGMPETDADLVFCVDETSEIDNLSFLVQQKSNPVKGLVLAVGPSNTDKNERIVLKKINSINSTIRFDAQKELAAYQEKKDSLEKIYNSYNDYNYTDTIAVDSAYAADYSYYDNYYMNQPEFCNYTGFYDLKFEGENSFSVGSTYMSNLCSYGYYLKKGEEEKFKTFALKDIKTVKKNFPKSGLMPKKDAEIFYEFLKKGITDLKKSDPSKNNYPNHLDAAAVEMVEVPPPAYSDSSYYDAYVSDYTSGYKTMKPEDSNFAITSLLSEPGSNYWKGMPSYCKKIDSIIPDFKDEELKKRAKNYAGQICDMYLGEFEGTAVWYKGTLDAIRAEQLYFNNNRDKFSKKDKELLDEFLNSLD